MTSLLYGFRRDKITKSRGLMMDLIKSLIEWVKLSLRYTLTLAILSGFLLFMGDSLARTFGLVEFRQAYKSWIALIFLFFLFLSLSTIIVSLGRYGSEAVTFRRATRNSSKALEQLTSEEKAILKGYIHGNTKTQTLPLESGVVNGLVSAVILYRSSQIARQWAGPGFGIDYNIADWAWNYLGKHPWLLDE